MKHFTFNFKWLVMSLLLCIGSSAWADTITFDFEDNTAHRTSGSNSYSTNSYTENSINISLTYADAVTTGSPLNGTANILGRVAKNTTNSPIVLIGPIDLDEATITGITYVTKGVATMSMEVEYSNNNTAWTSAQSIDEMPTASTDKEINSLNIAGSSTFYLRFTVSVSSSTKSNRDFQLDDVVITYSTGPSDTRTATSTAINVPGGFITDLANGTDVAAGTLTATVTPSGSDPLASPAITWTSSDTDVATIATNGAVTLKSVGATTITASYAGDETYKPSSNTYVLNVVNTYAKGQVNNPFTVAEANTAIAALSNFGTIPNQYVSGIISQVDSYNSTYHSITYWISDDGTTTNQLEVYGGLKTGDNSDNFSSIDDLKVGDVVTVFGTLKKYNSTYEFDKDNYLVSLVRKPAPTFSVSSTSATLEAYTHETADITLETNTDGVITCESSDNDVATVALKSAGVYTITAQTSGTATITIKAAASENYAKASATVTVTVNDSREDAGISFTNDEKEITWGDAFTGQALTNTHDVAVTWSSTNEDVATVDNTGAVTVLKAGTTDIKANFSGNATYKTAVASYTLTVNKAEAGLSFDETSFDIMLNDASFVAPTLNNPNGLTVTYTSSNTEVATVNTTTGELSYVSSAVGTAMITATFTTNDWYKGGSANYTINIIDPTVKGSKYNPYTVAEVIAVPTNTTINDVYVEGYIVGYVNSTYGFTRTTSSFTNTNWAIADDKDEEDVFATAPVQIASENQTTYGLSNHKDLVGAKVLIKGDITKYFTVSGVKSLDEINAKKEVKLNASGYATYACTNALNFSDDSEFSAWKVTGVTSTNITFTQIDGTVATGTGVILKGTASATVNIPVTATGTDISTTNKLVGITTATPVTADTYYGLSGDTFKKVGAGTVPAGKALLPASEIGAGVKVLNLVFDDATGISTIEQVAVDNKAWYDLQGRRVAQPVKGIYIHNGKKVFIK